MPRLAATPPSGLCAAVLSLGLAFAPAPAIAATPTGDGEFKSRGFTMPIASAIAFRGKSTLDQQDVIVVAITNGDADTAWFANFHDRRRAIANRIESPPDTAVVYLEFRPDGAYRGHSYYFQQGNGCGYCGGSMGVASTVKLAGGRLAGTLKIKDTDKTADIKLDVAILSDDHGPALPAGGGDPGKAYLAYHDAMVTGDPAKLRPHLSKANGQYIDDAVKRGKGAAMMKVFVKEHPTRSVKIVRGWSSGDRAVILFEGETSAMKLAGEAVLVREGGRWLVDEELSDVVMK